MPDAGGILLITAATYMGHRLSQQAALKIVDNMSVGLHAHHQQHTQSCFSNQNRRTCFVKDLLYSAKENQLSLLPGCDHVTEWGLLMQARGQAGGVAQAVALADTLLEVEGVLCEELHAAQPH